MTLVSWSVSFGETPSATKWNQLGSNDAHLADIVDPTEGDAWATWSPTPTNYAVGNGTQVAKYHQIGKSVNFKFKLTFGSTTSVSGQPAFTLPVTGTDTLMIFPCSLHDASGEVQPSTAQQTSTTVVTIYRLVTVTGSNPVAINRSNTISSTQPWTWTTSDVIIVNGTYEAA